MGRYLQTKIADHPLQPSAETRLVNTHRLILFDKIGPGTHACHWCGTPVKWRSELRADALIADHVDDNPRNNDPANLVPSCTACNSSRGNSRGPRPQPAATFGPPTIAELAYLAGLLDRSGGFITQPLGLKVRCGPELGQWLEDRFGGRWYVGYWWLRKQAEVADALARLEPYVIERRQALKLTARQLAERQARYGRGSGSAAPGRAAPISALPQSTRRG